MRVTFLTQWFDPEPAQFRGLPLARELVRRGFDIEVVTGFPNYPGGRLYPGYRMRPLQRETMDGVRVLRLPLYPSHDRNALRRVANYASFAAASAALAPVFAGATDVLYVYHPPPTVGIPAAVFRALRRVPVVYHIADMWPESAVESGMFGEGAIRDVAEILLDRYCKWVYSRCDAITVLSPGFAKLLQQRGVPPNKIHVVYNWADDAVFRPVERDESLARTLGLAGRFNVVYAGNLGAFQGLESVIKAASLLREDLPDLQVVFVGTGVQENRLKNLARETGASNVLFLGHRATEQMPAINALADALLVHLKDLPFFRTTIPGKTQVSLASGRPVIMAVAGDAAEIARRAGAGPIVRPEDAGALARAIRELRSLPEPRRTELGSRGRQYYLREMSLHVGAGRMSDLFGAVAGERRVTRSRSEISSVVVP